MRNQFMRRKENSVKETENVNVEKEQQCDGS